MDNISELTKGQQEETKLLLARIDDKLKFVSSRKRFANTDFLDLAQKKDIEDYLKQKKINSYIFYGGFEEAERTMLLLLPTDVPYDPMQNIDKTYDQIMKIIRIKLPKDLWGSYDHKMYLGALMKLGIERKKIGDILVRPDGADIIVSKDLVDFLKQNLAELTRFSKSEIEDLSIKEINYIAQEKKIININVPSMRLDAIVGELARVSRQDATRFLEEQRVFVDFKEEIRGTRQIKEGNVITIRGKGRFYITKILGTTRSGRYRIEVEKP